MHKPERHARSAIAVLVVLLLTTAAAQEFVFVTNRLRAEPPLGVTGAQLLQNELFLYSDGSELRLTDTPTESEWGPEPSPTGRYVAYLVQDTVVDWDDDEMTMDWNWYVRVMDLNTREVTGEWLLPQSSGQMLPAGGLGIAWQADEEALFVQIAGLEGEGGIVHIEPGSTDSRLLTRGYGVHLDAERGWLATTLHDSATVYNPLSGETMTLAPGEARGWVGTQVVIGGMGQLSLFDPVTAEQTVIDAEEGYYVSFDSEPDGYRHAWARYLLDTGETVVVVADEQFGSMATWLYPDILDSLRWLPGGSLLLNVLMGEHMTIMEVDMADGSEFVLVGSRFRDNTNARPLPAGTILP